MRFLAVLVFSLWPLAAADLRLSVAGLDGSRRPNLVLSGLGEGQYAIEASTNLARWFSLVSAPGTAGELRYLHLEAPSLKTVYYRGVQLPGTNFPFPKVTALIDSNYTAAGLITPAEGGRLALTNSGGTRFLFTVAPSNVLEPVPVTMRLISEFTDFPAENALRAAVAFEPEGFEFDGAGLLTIEFPTNVPHLKLASYSFNGDGSGFALLPDRVATNKVLIPIVHFSGAGTALWEPSAWGQTVIRHVEYNRDRLSQKLAEALGRDRQRQLLGDENANEAMEKIPAAMDEYYKDYLEPNFEAAKKDCGLAQALTRQVLGIERQVQLLGASEGTSFLASETFKDWTCNCLKEAFDACEKGTIGGGEFTRAVLGIERQAALLGTSGLAACGYGDAGQFIQDVIDKKFRCTQIDWVGSVTYTEKGSDPMFCSTATTTGAGGDPVTTTACEGPMSIAYSFEAFSDREELTDDSIPGFFESLTWDLYLIGTGNGTYSYERSAQKDYVCREEGARRMELADSIATVSGTFPLKEMKVHINVEDGVVTAFTLLHRAVEVEGAAVTTGSRANCPKKDSPPQDAFVTGSSTVKQIKSFDADFVNTDRITFTKRTPFEIEGTASGNRLEGGPRGLVEIPYTWKFRFERKQGD